jgi:RNase P subunit RPR2
MPARKGKTMGKEIEGYCMKCKAKHKMQEAKQVKMKNGKPAVQGKCPKCGTKMFRIGATL